MLICDYFRSEPDLTWKLAAQCGVNDGVIRLPENDGFDPADSTQLKAVIDRFKANGIVPRVVEPLPNSLNDHIKLGDDKRDYAIERFIALMKNLHETEVRTICFNFMAHYGWTRTDNNIPTRGGALVTGFEKERFRDDGFVIDSNKLWENYEYFIRAVVPYAEKYCIQLALHPDDPPLTSLGGVNRIFTSLDNIKKGISILESPCLGVTLCQACYYLMGEDLEYVIRTLSDKIFLIHFRNVRGNRSSFMETFHDDGDIDMSQALRYYIKYCPDNAKDIPIRVDHVPLLDGEKGRGDGYDSLGRLYAIGYLRGLLEACEGR